MKPREVGTTFRCECGNVVGRKVEGKTSNVFKKQNYCSECGEKMNWEKEEGSLRPGHYNKGIEVIEFTNSHNLNFNRGNVVKYICRAGFKDKAKEIEDLEKAKQYIDFEIKRLEDER